MKKSRNSGSEEGIKGQGEPLLRFGV